MRNYRILPNSRLTATVLLVLSAGIPCLPATSINDNASGFTVDRAVSAKGWRTESPAEFNARMAWWREARVGVMISFGVFSIPAEGEWYMRWRNVPVAKYQEYAPQFNPTRYNPEEWARLFKEAGSRYVVFIAKHHDGFAMWPSKASVWNIANATPYGKDFMGPLVAACRKEGLKFGIYYSQAQDWVNPGGSPGGGNAKPWDPAQEGDFDEYLSKVALPQVKELLAYEPDIFWFDTPVSMTKERVEPFIAELKPFKNLIINDRLGGGGDFASSEQMIPTYPLPRDLEVCMTLGSKWSYAPASDKHKSPRDVIAKMVETVSKNGNMIYGFGPAPDGTFPDTVTERLKIMGEWLKRNGEVIYGTQGGPFPYLSYGFATRSKGGRLNLIVFDWPKDGHLRVPILSAVKGARLLGSSETLEISRDDQRVTVKVPATAPDPIASVVILELDGDLVVRSNPTEYASVKASHNEKDAPNMLALDSKRNYWITPKGTTTATLDFSFKKPAVISAVRLGEPDIWPRVEQAYVLEAEINGAWKKVSEGVTGGVGARLDFEPVTTLALKLTLTTKTGVPGMAKVLFISPE